MALATAITLNTDAAKTEDMVFVPIAKSGNVVTYGSALFLASETRPTLTMGFSPRSASRPTDKIRCDLNVPYGTVVDGNTVSVDTTRVRIEVTIPENVPLAERDDVANMALTLAEQAPFLNMIKVGEGVW